MSIAGISSTSASTALAAAQRASAGADASTLTNSGSKKGTANDPAAIKKAATQFEAIILRQLLAPAIEPVMSGGMGAEKGSGAGGGGGVYGYMLTDALADNLSKGGGLGLAKMLEKQFSPHAASTSVTSSAALNSQPSSIKTP